MKNGLLDLQFEMRKLNSADVFVVCCITSMMRLNKSTSLFSKIWISCAFILHQSDSSMMPFLISESIAKRNDRESPFNNTYLSTLRKHWLH